MRDNIWWSEIRESVLEYTSKTAFSDAKLAFADNLGWLRYETQLKFLDKILPKKSKILDIGCGWGHTTAMLSALHPDSKVIGVDLSEVPLWNDFRKYGCKLMIGSGLNLPFKDEAFDAVVSFGVTEHVTDDKKFLSEINRVLRVGGGNVIFNLPQVYALTEFFAKLLGLSHHDKKYAKKEIYNLLIETHFRVDYMKKEHLIPAQVYRLSRLLNEIFNKLYLYLDKADFILSKTPPFMFFLGSFRIVSIKIGNEKVGMQRLKRNANQSYPPKWLRKLRSK